MSSQFKRGAAGRRVKELKALGHSHSAAVNIYRKECEARRAEQEGREPRPMNVVVAESVAVGDAARKRREDRWHNRGGDGEVLAVHHTDEAETETEDVSEARPRRRVVDFKG